jgi:hypothetical protein
MSLPHSYRQHTSLLCIQWSISVVDPLKTQNALSTFCTDVGLNTKPFIKLKHEIEINLDYFLCVHCNIYDVICQYLSDIHA